MHDRNVTTIKPHPGATHSKATAQYRVIADQCILGACQHVESTCRHVNCLICRTDRSYSLLVQLLLRNSSQSKPKFAVVDHHYPLSTASSGGRT